MILITDAIIEPYVIKYDNGSFEVLEKKNRLKQEFAVVPEHARTPEMTEPYMAIKGYYSSLDSCIKKVVSLKLSKKKDTVILSALFEAIISTRREIRKTLTSYDNI